MLDALTQHIYPNFCSVLRHINFSNEIAWKVLLIGLKSKV
jgi:hypothetical protein